MGIVYQTKLEAALALGKRGFKLFPLVHNRKIPTHEMEAFYDKATSENAILTKWFNPGYFNLAISTDSFLVIDIDPKKNGIENAQALADEGFLFPATFTQGTPSGGYHLFYKVSSPVKNSQSAVADGVDVRGWHGFVVAAGSVVDEVPYTIVDDQDPVDAPAWLLTRVKTPTMEKPRATEIAVHVDPDVAWDRGKLYLESIPHAAEGQRNGEAYKAAARLKDIGLHQTDAFGLMLEYWKCEPMLEHSEIGMAVRSAYTYGLSPQGIASPEAMFPSSGISVDLADTDPALHPLLTLNENFAFLAMEGKHRILHETTDSEGRFKLRLLEENTFHAELGARMFNPDAANPKPLSRTWMTHERRRSYEGLVFKPGIETGNRFYNLWRGFGVKPLGSHEAPTDAMKRAFHSFTTHIFENVANFDSDHYEWVMSWFAHMIQKPHEKPETALVLKGRKGVGKNAIFETFKPIFPDHYLVSGDRRYLISNFNGHLERLLLFVIDEAFWSGDKSAEGVLKSLITDRRINIEKKGKDPATIESCHRIAILGNEKWVVPASHDERRYAVFNMGENNKQNRKFFRQMSEDMQIGQGNRYLFSYLKNFDIKMDVGQVPFSDALLEQKLQSLDLFQQWWLDCLVAGAVVGSGETTWVIDFRMSDFKDYYSRYAGGRGRSQYLESDSNFVKGLHAVCPGVKAMRDGVLGFKITLPSFSDARTAWDTFIGHKMQWDKL